MPGNTCIVCGNTCAKDKSVSMHRFPKDQDKRRRWIEALDLKDVVIKDYHRVCSRHFPDADGSKDPQLTFGKRFASPKKHWTDRAKRAKIREEATRELPAARELPFSSVYVDPSSSSEPGPSTVVHDDSHIMIAEVGEALESDYQLHELPTDGNLQEETSTVTADTEGTVSLVSAALLARIDLLESENRTLTEKLQVAVNKRALFRIEDIAGNDKLVKLYTGFPSYEILLSFFEFLGPAVSHLNYWSEKEKEKKCLRRRKLDPINQFFLT